MKFFCLNFVAIIRYKSLNGKKTVAKHNLKYWLFKSKYLVAFAIFLIVIFFVGESSLINRIEQKREITKLKEEIDEYNRKFANDKKVLDALKHDDNAVKDVARSRYYMRTDDEDIFIIEDSVEDEE